jgi:hypothetical protein
MYALNKIAYNQDVFFILLTLSFFLIALLKGMYWKHAKLLFKGVYAQRYANQYLREENAFTERVNLLTFLLMSINFTLVISKLVAFYDWQSISMILILVLLFFLMKITILQFLGFVFKAKDLSKLTVFFSLLFDRTLGFVLFPLVIMLYFFSLDISSIVIIISFISFLVLLWVKLFWLWKIGTNSFGLSRFYIFLYLCTLEIFPLLLLGRGVVY